MKLIYKGKTKNVFELENGNILLKFKDDVTGKDGVFDPGANEVGLSIKGIGNTNLKVTDYFFRKLSDAGFETHHVSSNLENGEMEVLNCKPFGKGIEVIFRNFAVGSFLRRYGLYAEEMMSLNDYVEVTLKDDKRQDPLITEDALIQLDILTKEELENMIFGIKAIKNANSNGVVLVKNEGTIGYGFGEVRRSWAVEKAIERAGENITDCVLASDGFFFEDTIELLKEHGVKAALSPGGSIHDKDVILLCDKYDMALVFTGTRHFKH